MGRENTWISQHFSQFPSFPSQVIRDPRRLRRNPERRWFGFVRQRKIG
jgi:hypothetical protein